MSKRMRVWLAVLMGGMLVGSAQAVDPMQTTFTNKMSDANGAQINPGTVYAGTTLILTNCVARNATDTGAENLTGVSVTITYGVVGSTTTNTATAAVGADGMWSTSLTIPATLSSFYIQTSLDDGDRIYPKKIIAVEPVL